MRVRIVSVDLDDSQDSNARYSVYLTHMFKMERRAEKAVAWICAQGYDAMIENVHRTWIQIIIDNAPENLSTFLILSSSLWIDPSWETILVFTDAD
jgi:hypothetical protein